MSIVPSTIAATQGAKEGQAGLASGLVNTSRQVGGGLGLAVLITLATQRTTHLIGSGQQVAEALTHGFRAGLPDRRGPGRGGGADHVPALPRAGTPRRGAVRRLALAIGVGARGASSRLTVAFAGTHGAPIGAYTTDGAYSFVTAPSLHPPKIRSHAGRRPAAQLAPGYIFTANFYDLNEPPIVGQSGPLILDRNLQPVWFQPVPEKLVAANLSLQTYQGKPALAWWQGARHEHGRDRKRRRRGRQPALPDGREAESDGRLGADAARVPDRRRRRVGDGEQEHPDEPLEVRRRLQRRADRLGRAGVQPQDRQAAAQLGRARSHPAERVPGLAADQRLPLGRLPRQLDRADRQRNVPGLDAQHLGAPTSSTSTPAGSSGPSAASNSSFKFGPGAAFQWQHDVRAGARLDGHPVRRSLLPADRRRHLRRRRRRRRAGSCSSSTSRRAHGDARGPVHAAATTSTPHYMGDTQPLPNGNVFVGWGSEPYFSEYSRSGKLLFEGELPGPNLTYRATVEQWVGEPLSPARGAARRADGRTTVYASWNGATQVASWRVLAGSSAGRLSGRGERRQVRLRDGDPGAAGLCELRGPGARRRRPRDRSLATIHRRMADAEDASAGVRSRAGR